MMVVTLNLVVGCDAEPVAEDLNPNNTGNKQLQVTVKHYYKTSGGIDADSGISGAIIYLYETAENRQFDLERQKVGTTDSAGLTLLEHLTLDYYFVKATHPLFNQLNDEVSTPAHASKSFLEMIHQE